jgi:hypothetical protein
LFKRKVNKKSVLKVKILSSISMSQGYTSNNTRAKFSKCNEKAYFEMTTNPRAAPSAFYEEDELTSTRRNSSLNNKSTCFSNDRRFSIAYSSADEDARNNRNGHDAKKELSHESLKIGASAYKNINKSSFSLGDLDDLRKPVNSTESIIKKTSDKSNIFTKLIKAMHDTYNKPLFLERLINKNGYANINRINLKSRRLRYFSDLFNTIIDMNWGNILLLFVISFLISWTFFAILWFFNPADCVAYMTKKTFLEAFLFSIETQQTIGYGSRFIGKECCWQALVVLMLQCCLGVILESLMGGIVFAKLSKPQNSKTFKFKKQKNNLTKIKFHF